jgi:glucosamine-6-phosphate isomerase
MQLLIHPNYESLSEFAATLLTDYIKEKPNAVLCLAAGETPLLTYQKWVKKMFDEKIDYQHCTFIGLDEWVGIAPENSGSCHFFLQENIFKPLKIKKNRIFLFDAMAHDIQAQCQKMNDIIVEKNGIDLILVGVGMNGHIGFNEPGVAFNKYAHVIDLDEKTQTVGQKYFKENTQLSQGITLGLKHFLEAKQAIVIANGIKKAEIVKKMLEESVSPNTPASIVNHHPQGIVAIDTAAASLLKKKEK